jgi:hypothetical protein
VAISLLGRHFNNVLMDKSVQLLSTQNAEEAARSNRNLIQSLAGPETEEAARAFATLIADP